MNTTELNDKIDELSVALRENVKKSTAYLNSDDGELDVYMQMEDEFDSIQAQLATLHDQLGIAYRLEELDENCD